MSAPRTLIAATDLSAPARHAAERAAQLAQRHPGARLTLAHVVSAGGLDALRRLLAGDAGALESGVLERAAKDLAALAADLAARHGCRVDTELLRGSPLAALAELADAREADLLVMGARGARFLRELLPGPTAERMLRTARRPVLIVKQRPQAPYRRILAAVDFSAHAAAAIDAAHAWLPDADIVLLNAFEVELESTLRLAGVHDDTIHAYRIRAREAAKAEMDAFVGRLQVPRDRLTRHFVHGPAALRIVEHERTLDADLIVMGKHGQSVMEELLLGSVTRHVLAYCTSDVFIAGGTA